MSNNKFEKIGTKLKFVGKVYYGSCNFQHKIKALFDDNNIELVEGVWFGRSKFNSHGDKKNLTKDLLLSNDAWSTYDGCQEISIYYNSRNKLEVSVLLYNGENLNGFRVGKRWEGVFKGAKLADLRDFHSTIEYSFNDSIECAYNLEQEIKAKNRINEIKSQVLSGNYN